MNQKNFTVTIEVSKSPEEVFAAINNVKGWWQGEVTGNTTKAGDEFEYRMKEFHYSKQKIVESIPYKKVVWLVIDSKLTSARKQDEWTGTKINFEISEHNNKTQLRFSHIGLVSEFECYGSCSNAWTQLIQKSLFSFITTGKGEKVFNH